MMNFCTLSLCFSYCCAKSCFDVDNHVKYINLSSVYSIISHRSSSLFEFYQVTLRTLTVLEVSQLSRLR